ncbi:MAG TPA: NAD-dependent 4,6-dehydratase LegB [Caproiciproducens sp.]|nr:NAD-dependent 4,6-dehydratase LegB [Caproiciproducens sp.]
MGFKGKRLLVTGADGFIGSHLTEKLVSAGYSVRAFVCYNSFNSWGWLDHSPAEVKNALEVFPGDIRDPYRVKKAMEGCGAVFHLAALVAIPYSYYSPGTYIDTNIKGTLNVLQAARELGTERIVHTSTSEVYGTARYVPIPETHPLQAQSPYAASKIGADQLALSFYHSFSTPVTVVRPFNTYGPRQSDRAVIPTVITQLAKGNRKIKLGSVTPKRDFNYVRDTVRGFIEAAECDAAVGEVVNLGSNYEISIEETVQMIAEIMEAEVEIETEARRVRPEKSEVQRLWADTAKAVKLFGWNPEYGGRDGLRKGLQETVEWFGNPENLKYYKTDRYNL